MERLREIDRLVGELFSGRWKGLHAEGSLRQPELKLPGVYLLSSYTDAALEGASVEARDVFYVGMSNAAGGVKQRLGQFVKGIEKNDMHSGAMRFYRDYCSGRPFSDVGGNKRLYFRALTLDCVSRKAAAQPDDLRLMGHVTCLEYYAIAHVATETGHRPALNKLGAAEIQNQG